MDFGMTSYDSLSKESLQLPSPFIPIGLSKTPYLNPGLYIGLTKWNNSNWKGKMYPNKIKDSETLSYYAKKFNSVELNATHYSIYSNAVINKWREMVKDADFLFCPKFVNKISHFGSPDPELKKEVTDAFLSSIYEFKNHLGPAFIQFTDSFTVKRYPVLLQYLKSLPIDLEVFVECRHESWFNDKSFLQDWTAELKSINKGLVITDTPGRRDILHMQLTVPKAFIRFVCNGNSPLDDYRIQQWKEQLKFWYANGLEQCFFFLHIHDSDRELEFANWVQTELTESIK